MCSVVIEAGGNAGKDAVPVHGSGVLTLEWQVVDGHPRWPHTAAAVLPQPHDDLFLTGAVRTQVGSCYLCSRSLTLYSSPTSDCLRQAVHFSKVNTQHYHEQVE